MSNLLRCETVGRHFVQPAADVDAVCLVVSGIYLSASEDDGLLQRVLPHGLLRASKRFSIHACRPGAKNRCAISSFTARAGGCDLGTAPTPCRFDFFREGITVDSDRDTALRAELHAASLIHFSKRP